MDMTKLIGTFCDYVNVPKSGRPFGCDAIKSGTTEITFQRDRLPPSLGHVLLKHQDPGSVGVVTSLWIG
jgi:hypothetical protein